MRGVTRAILTRLLMSLDTSFGLAVLFLYLSGCLLRFALDLLCLFTGYFTERFPGFALELFRFPFSYTTSHKCHLLLHFTWPMFIIKNIGQVTLECQMLHSFLAATVLLPQT